MPFYVMYQLTPASVGSALAWQGQVFWEQPNGQFEEITHEKLAARRITSEDAGQRVYAAFFPKRDARLDVRFEPSAALRLAGWVKTVLTVTGGLAVLMLLIRPRWRALVPAFSLFVAGYLLIVSFLAISAGKYLGAAYPPQGGGDDGMVHDGWGRAMAMLAGEGRVVEALKGEESVYWFTPGMRYFRMIEKLIFGDTNLLLMLVVACVPIVIFYLVRHLAGLRWAWVAAAAFCMAPVGNPSLLQFIANAKLGYGEAAAGGLFLLGLVLLLRTLPEWGGTERNLPMTTVAGAALAPLLLLGL